MDPGPPPTDDGVPAPRASGTARQSDEPEPAPAFPVGAAALLLLLVVIVGYVGMRAIVGGPRRPGPPVASTPIQSASLGAHPSPAWTSPPSAHPPGEDPSGIARSGDFARASGLWARHLASGPARDGWTVQLTANCETSRLKDLLVAPGVGSQTFLLPVSINGRSCYRVCAGLYEVRAEADRRAREITSRPPAPGVVARAVLLADLLPPDAR